MTLQTFVSPKKLFSLDYPRIWEMEVVENIPAFFNPIEGQGALQIFSIRLDQKTKIPKELKHFNFLNAKNLLDKMIFFLNNQNIKISEKELKIYTKKKMSFIPYEYSLEKRFYMVCMLQEKNILLLSIYNCSGIPDKKEATIIGQIMSSVQII